MLEEATMKRACVLVAVVLGLSSLGAPLAQRSAGPADDATARVVTAARTFLASLDEGQRAKASLELSAKSRAVWSNLPSGATLQTGATERNGLKLALMTPAQEKAALALVAAMLSRDGYQKVMAIVDADQLLEERSGPRAPGSRTRFGRGEYYVAILGTPSTTAPWMAQFGGHHLAVNVTIVGRENVLTPSHTGAQPASYTVEGRTIRPLGDENDKAFALMAALSAEQQKQALLGYDVRNLVLPPGADGKVIQPEGIRASAFSAAQRGMLVDLVREWVGIIGDEAAARRMKEVEASIAETYFAWAGPTTPGRGAYFRIQGPAVFIEYAPQGQGENNVDHIHTMYRDPTNDYAAKAIGQ
jgi:hypothetical protein